MIIDISSDNDKSNRLNYKKMWDVKQPHNRLNRERQFNMKRGALNVRQGSRGAERAKGLDPTVDRWEESMG